MGHPFLDPLDRELNGVMFRQGAPGIPSQNFQLAGTPGEQNAWSHYPTGMGYVCQLTNYGPVTVSNVKITFGLRFKEVVKQGPNAYQAGITKFSDAWLCVIRKIDPGVSERFVFYLKNLTKDFLEVSIPEFVELRRFRETEQRKIPLLRHDDQNVVLFLLP